MQTTTQIKTCGLHGRAAWSPNHAFSPIWLVLPRLIWMLTEHFSKHLSVFKYRRELNYNDILHSLPLITLNCNHAALHVNKVLQQTTLRTDKDNREKDMHTKPDARGSIFMEFVKCTDQIHKLGEDFTLNFGNMPLIISQGWGRRRGEAGERKERTETEVKTGRGEQNLPLTVSLTFWWATGARDDQQERERERETVTERDISCTSATWSWADLLGDCYKCPNH